MNQFRFRIPCLLKAQQIIINDMIRIHVHSQFSIEDNIIDIIKVIGHFRNFRKAFLEKPVRISIKSNKVPRQKSRLLTSRKYRYDFLIVSRQKPRIDARILPICRWHDLLLFVQSVIGILKIIAQNAIRVLFCDTFESPRFFLCQIRQIFQFLIIIFPLAQKNFFLYHLYLPIPSTTKESFFNDFHPCLPRTVQNSRAALRCPFPAADSGRRRRRTCASRRVCCRSPRTCPTGRRPP